MIGRAGLRTSAGVADAQLAERK